MSKRKGREYEQVKTTYVKFEDFESGNTPLPTREEALAGIKSCESVPKLFSQIKAFLMQINGSGTGGSGTEIPVLTEPITKTIDIVDLQAEIDALPKILMADVTFIVKAGTYAGEILIEGFIGSGALTINGANAVGQTTHNISNMGIMYCNNSRITIQGFNATATTGMIFKISNCPGANIILIYCNSTAGINTTTGVYGVHVMESNFVRIEGCTFSNKLFVIRVLRSKATIIDLSGTNNNNVYNAGNSGIIQKENAGTITGILVNDYTRGGQIVNPSGIVMGS